jgi:hypothetical protein
MGLKGDEPDQKDWDAYPIPYQNVNLGLETDVPLVLSDANHPETSSPINEGILKRLSCCWEGQIQGTNSGGGDSDPEREVEGGGSASDHDSDYETYGQEQIAVGNDTISTDDLQRLHYVINSRWRVLICTSCRSCVAPSMLVHHLRKHQLSESYKDLIDALCQNYQAYAHDKPPRPQNIIPAIYGLTILPGYHLCSFCNQGYSKTHSLKTHQAKCPYRGGARNKSFMSNAQTFFKGTTRSYFPVFNSIPPPSTSISTDFELYLGALPPEINLYEEPIVAPSNYRNLSQFLAHEGWTDHVAGIPPKVIDTPLKASSDDPILSRLSPLVNDYLILIQEELGQATYAVQLRMAMYGRSVKFT